MEKDKYTQRLINEWRQYGKIIISVDYDSTISYWPTIDNREDIDRAIRLLQIARETGAYITIFTASDIDKFEEIQTHCDKIKLPIDSINKNAIPLPYGNHGKIYYNINLCDRSGLTQALDMLETAIYVIRGERAVKLTEGESI